MPILLNKRALIMIGAIAAVLLVGALILFLPTNQGTEKIRQIYVTMWGPLESEREFGTFLQSSVFPANVTIKYDAKSLDTYEEDLLRAFAQGTAPDLFYIKNSSLPRFRDFIQSLPSVYYNEYKEAFVDVAVKDFVDPDLQMHAVPLFIDSLALYWNRDLFNSAGIANPPKTWKELQAQVELLTRKDVALNITRAGVALGGVDNVNHASDIIYALLLQNGNELNTAKWNPNVMITGFDKRPVEFYLEFSNPQKTVYTWNRDMHHSVDLFAEGKLAMMFGYAYEAAVLKQKNPYLNFGVAEFPQLAADAGADGTGNKKTTFADYWGIAAWRRSPNVVDASSVLHMFMARGPQEAYASKLMRPTAFRGYIPAQMTDPLLGVFARQALFADTWHQVDDVKIKGYVNEMLRGILSKTEPSIDNALLKLDDQINYLARLEADRKK